MALDAQTYPRARVARAGPTPKLFAPPEEGAVITPPEVTNFTFELSTVANSRSTVSSRKLYGPAIIRAYDIVLGGAPNGVQTLELGIASSAVTETNTGIDAPRAWRSVFTRLTETAPGDPAGRIGLPQPDFGSSVRAAQDNLNYVVVETEFFLVVCNRAAGAGADTFAGNVVIAERVAPEVIANFL